MYKIINNANNIICANCILSICLLEQIIGVLLIYLEQYDNCLIVLRVVSFAINPLLNKRQKHPVISLMNFGY